MTNERIGQIGRMRLDFLRSGTVATGGVFYFGAEQPLRFIGFAQPPAGDAFTLTATLPRLRDMPRAPRPQRGRPLDLAAHVGMWCGCRCAEVLLGMSKSQAQRWVSNRACNVWMTQGAADERAVRRSERIAEDRGGLAGRPFFVHESDGRVVVFDDPALLANAAAYQVLRGPAWVWTPQEACATYGWALLDLQRIVKVIK